MSNQNTNTNDVPTSEEGYVTDNKTDSQKNPQSGHGGTGTAIGRSEDSRTPGSGTGTAPKNPGTERQNPGTSGREEDVTGDAMERSPEGASEANTPIRNPSGDTLGDAIDGDEGSGKRV